MLRPVIEDHGAMQRLNGIALRAEKIPVEVMKEIGDELIKSQQRNFDEGGRPSPWMANLTGTPTLIGAGRLRNSFIISEVSESSVEVQGGGDLPYRFIHQFGGVIRAKNKPYLVFQVNGHWVKKKQVTIPARKYMRIQDEDVQMVEQKLSQYLLKGE